MWTRRNLNHRNFRILRRIIHGSLVRSLIFRENQKKTPNIRVNGSIGSAFKKRGGNSPALPLSFNKPCVPCSKNYNICIRGGAMTSNRGCLLHDTFMIQRLHLGTIFKINLSYVLRSKFTGISWANWEVAKKKPWKFSWRAVFFYLETNMALIIFWGGNVNFGTSSPTIEEANPRWWCVQDVFVVWQLLRG